MLFNLRPSSITVCVLVVAMCGDRAHAKNRSKEDRHMREIDCEIVCGCSLRETTTNAAASNGEITTVNNNINNNNNNDEEPHLQTNGSSVSLILAATTAQPAAVGASSTGISITNPPIADGGSCGNSKNDAESAIGAKDPITTGALGAVADGLPSSARRATKSGRKDNRAGKLNREANGNRRSVDARELDGKKRRAKSRDVSVGSKRRSRRKSGGEKRKSMHRSDYDEASNNNYRPIAALEDFNEM